MCLFQRSYDLFQKHGGDFNHVFKWHLANGVVQVFPNSILLGYFCKRTNFNEITDEKESDCFYASFCMGDMLEASQIVANKADYLAFRRMFKQSERVRLLRFKDFQTKINHGRHFIAT